MRSVGLALALTLVVLCGCSKGPRLVPVTGKVTVGGKPAEGAVAMFHPDDSTLPVSSATATADGTLSPYTNSQPGLMEGHYKVTITYPDPTKKPTQAQIMMGTADVGPDLLKGKYGSKTTTTLSADVTAGMQTLPPFEL
jgi:hypothetical protein